MKKKKSFLVLLMLMIATCYSIIDADNNNFQYQYDAAGNRISRIVVEPQPHQAQKRNLRTVDFTVSPTITSDVVTIATAIDVEKTSMRYTLISVQGNVLDTGNITSQRTDLSMGGYANGIYLLTIETNSNVETFKIIKQ
jgi:hypothetical protein